MSILENIYHNEYYPGEPEDELPPALQGFENYIMRRRRNWALSLAHGRTMSVTWKVESGRRLPRTSRRPQTAAPYRSVLWRASPLPHLSGFPCHAIGVWPQRNLPPQSTYYPASTSAGGISSGSIIKPSLPVRALKRCWIVPSAAGI